VLEPSTARTLAAFTNTPERSPAITVNRFGKGRAIYLATAAQPAFIAPLLRSLYQQLDIRPGPVTPKGVVARSVDGRTLYVNTTDAPATITFEGKRTDILTGAHVDGSMELPPYGAELLQ